MYNNTQQAHYLLLWTNLWTKAAAYILIPSSLANQRHVMRPVS